VEVPFLGSSSISGLDDNVSVVDDIEISVFSHLRDNIEISVNIHTESLVEFTLLWFSLPLVSIDDIPLLRNMVLSGS
jgi:hypothetical protein